LTTQTKLSFWFNQYDDEIAERVFYFIERKFSLSKSTKRRVTFKEIREEFKEVPPPKLFEIVKFVVQQKNYYMYFSTYFKDWTIRCDVPLTRKERIFMEMLKKDAEEMGGFEEVWKQKLEPLVDRYVAEHSS
jgi:hypothetical protein